MMTEAKSPLNFQQTQSLIHYISSNNNDKEVQLSVQIKKLHLIHSRT